MMDQLMSVGFVQLQNQSKYGGESNLDFEYAMTLTDPTPVTLLQTGDLIQGLSLRSRDEYVPLISILNF